MDRRDCAVRFEGLFGNHRPARGYPFVIGESITIIRFPRTVDHFLRSVKQLFSLHFNSPLGLAANEQDFSQVITPRNVISVNNVEIFTCACDAHVEHTVRVVWAVLKLNVRRGTQIREKHDVVGFATF